MAFRLIGSSSLINTRFSLIIEEKPLWVKARRKQFSGQTILFLSRLWGLMSTFCLWMPSRSSTFVERVIFLPLNCFFYLPTKSVEHVCVGLYKKVFYSITWFYVLIPLPEVQCLDYCSYIVDFNYQVKWFLTFYSYFKVIRYVLKPITFHINFRIFYVYRIFVVIFAEIFLNP